MKILYLSDILNVHDERLMSQFKEAGHDMTLLTFFHRGPDLPEFTKDHRVIHEQYEFYPDGAGASRWKLIRAKEYKRDEAREARSNPKSGNFWMVSTAASPVVH